jgi:hypothetical protein
VAGWTALPLRDARAGFAAIASELRPAADGLVDLAGAARSAGPVPARLLPALEPAGLDADPALRAEVEDIARFEGALSASRTSGSAA